jgi:hypothetical protein
MDDNFYIAKDRKLDSSVDYTFLREEGLKYIESLTSEIWTDYNPHDPGITILESAVYAMTELGYRAGFDIKDLLTQSDGKIVADKLENRTDTFFTAREILTNRPLTAEDYRKLLIDIQGVNNAWIFPEKSVTINADETSPILPENELPIYANCKEDRLVYKLIPEKEVELRGLNKVLLELEDTIEYGDLNQGNIYHTFTEADIRGIVLEAFLPYWKKANQEAADKIRNGQFKIHSAVFKESAERFEITLLYGSGFSQSLSFHLGYTLKSKVTKNLTKILTQLNQKVTYTRIFDVYLQKIKYVHSIIHAAHVKLMDNRNLGEDVIDIDTVKAVEIAICADIDVLPTFDIEKILAEVYYRIHKYFSPSVQFYLLKELLSKGISAESIFEGPKLDHGFIDAEELQYSQLRSEIRVSDLINEMMDIEGVISIKNIMLTAYQSDGKPILPSEKWCLHLPDYSKPVLNIHKSKILFYKDRIPFSPNLQEAYDTYQYLKGISERPKLIGQLNDLAVPMGSYYDFSQYHTLQYELPQTYGISAFGLPTAASDEHKAQALQLRAYLMFFDQILADFFAQLHNAKKLLSIDSTLDRTYYSNYITDVLDIDKVYNSTNLSAIFDAPVQDTSEVSRSHRDLVENTTTYYQRRNKFLDHLIARFAESFNEYVLMMYDIEGNKVNQNELLKDKINFLKDYPTTSSERGRGYDYYQPSWISPSHTKEEKIKRSKNVSGLEKRIARLTGIDNYSRRNLFCLPDIKITKTGTQFSFALIDSTSTWLISMADSNLNSQEKADAIVNGVYENFLTEAQYSIEHITRTECLVYLRDSSRCKIATAPTGFSTEAKAKEFIKKLISHFKPTCDSEGMHLIEYILLRPRFQAPFVSGKSPEDVYKLMNVCLDDDCGSCGENDPYSFQVSIILPYWTERFSNLHFRKYFEKMIQTEAPAHIAVKVCWISFTAMKKFETIFKRWNEALMEYSSKTNPNTILKNKYMKASNDMIDFLSSVKSVYPKAHLHDCEEGTVNPVRLGSTVLGSY